MVDHNGEGLKGSPNICPDICRPPLPPPPPELPLPLETLTPPTPTITVDCKKAALGIDLKRFVFKTHEFHLFDDFCWQQLA